MRLFVSKEQKVTVAIATVYLTVAAIVDLTGAIRLVLLVFFIYVFGSVFFRIAERPPAWLLRTPLGRWLPFLEPVEEIERRAKAGSGAARSTGSR